jgi:ethanolamine utilization protein EutA
VHVPLDLSAETIDERRVTAAIREAAQRMDLAPESQMAIAFSWKGEPEFSRLHAMGRGIVAAVAPEGRRDAPLLLMIEGDVGNSLGHLLCEELGLPGSLISVDGVQLQELDYVDVGERIDPPGVVPIVIKSLLFT